MDWKAIYHDGVEFCHTEKDGIEHKFGDIDMNKLECFEIEDFGHKIKVWPETGKYEINGQTFQYDNFSEDEYLELVYFKRVRATINSVTGMKPPKLFQKFIGLRNVGKANKVRSRQLLIQLSKDNGVVIQTK